MKIKHVSIEDHIEYIRYARTETILALGGSVLPSIVEPVPCASYLLAFENESSQSIGMAEAAMHKDIYGSYKNLPYSAHCDLNQFCPIEEMAGIRSIFVKSEYRVRSPLFLCLTAAAMILFRTYGATHSTLTTNASDTYLNKLYQRMGAKLVTTFESSEGFECMTNLYVVNFEELLNHRVYRRCLTRFEFEANVGEPAQFPSALKLA